MKKFLLLLLFACSAVFSSAQSVIGGDSLSVSYGAPKEYTLVKVNVVGTVFVNPEIVVLISGLPSGLHQLLLVLTQSPLVSLMDMEMLHQQLHQLQLLLVRFW